MYRGINTVCVIEFLVPSVCSEEGVSQALLHCRSFVWVFIDHPLNEILGNRILNMLQVGDSLQNVVFTYNSFAEWMLTSRKDVVYQHPSHLKG